MKAPRGFTIIELMIVVAIIGILSMLAMTGYKGYMASAKSGEAKSSLGSVGKLALASYEKESGGNTTIIAAGGLGSTSSKTFCTPGVPNAIVPALIPKGAKYQSTNADWAASAGFTCLGFSMTGGQYYSYGYRATAAVAAGAAQTFTTWACGDLNSNGAVTACAPATVGAAAASDVAATDLVSYFALNGGTNTVTGPTLAPSMIESFPTE